MTGGKGSDVFVLSPGKDVVTDFDVTKDAVGVVYAIDMKFKQKGSDLKIKGDDNVKTLLLNVDKDEFLAAFPDNLQIVPVVDVDIM